MKGRETMIKTENRRREPNEREPENSDESRKGRESTKETGDDRKKNEIKELTRGNKQIHINRQTDSPLFFFILSEKKGKTKIILPLRLNVFN